MPQPTRLAAVTGAFRMGLGPGAEWQWEGPLQVLREHQVCRPQVGPGATEAGPDARAPGCGTWWGRPQPT